MKLRQVLALGIALLLTSCLPANNKVLLYKIRDGSATLTMLNDASEVATLMESNKNFVFVAYADEDCNCWQTFSRRIISAYIEDFAINFYAIDVAALDGEYYGLSIIHTPTSDNTPVIGIYEKGTYKYGLNYGADKRVFNDYNAFKRWIGRYVTLS